MIAPPLLRTGDTVAIVSPSSCVEADVVHGAVRNLKERGFNPVIYPHALGTPYGNFAATHSERLADLQAALDAPDVRAILCSRGGYGAIHLLAGIDLTKFRQSPKWLVGFSDITALHCLLQANGFQSLHASMAKAFAYHQTDEDIIELITNNRRDGMLTTQSMGDEHTVSAVGVLRGGNLAVLHALCSTPYTITGEDTILLIEDVGERPYRVERMLYTLKLNGTLSRLKGLVVGQFTEYEEDRALGCTLHEAIQGLVSEYNYPVIYNYPVGHIDNNKPLVLGRRYAIRENNPITPLIPCE